MKKNESGRSMVEMLGVLAIIGVLSVGGIAGYTLAMNKYRVGEATQAIALASVSCISGDGQEQDYTVDNIVTINPCNGSEVSFTLDASVDAADVEAALDRVGVATANTFTAS